MEERVWFKAYDPDVPTDLDFQDIPLPAYLENSAQRFPEAAAVTFLNCKLSYRELQQEVGRVANGLRSLGVQQGDSVAVHMPNVPQTVIATQAVLAAGAKAVMTNPLYVSREIEHQWNDSGCKVALTMDFLYERSIESIRGKLPVEHYIVASIPEYLGFPLNLLAPIKLKKMDPPSIAKVRPGAGIHFFKKWSRGFEPSFTRPEIGMDDIAMLQYTGGTTGVSKGAMLSHRNLSCNVQQTNAWFPAVEPGREVLLASLPYFHIFGLTIAMLWPISAGANMVLMPNPRDLPGTIKNISKHRVTLWPAVPALFNAVNQYPGIEDIDISSVKSCFSGSAPLPLDVQERFEELTGAKIVEGYGLTETSPVTHVNPLFGVRKIGTVGIPVPETDARIVDPEDGSKTLPSGQEGEILLRGPQVMQGYWQRPEETDLAVKDGWLYTGDLGVMDEDGYFKIVGRKKDMIIASGYNIYPDEIDNVLMSHPAILEACTIGVPDPKRGETVKSFVVLNEGYRLSEDELLDFCREQLAAYKVPRMLEFRDKLPKSSMMKLLRRVLRDESIAESD